MGYGTGSGGRRHQQQPASWPARFFQGPEPPSSNVTRPLLAGGGDQSDADDEDAEQQPRGRRAGYGTGPRLEPSGVGSNDNSNSNSNEAGQNAWGDD